MVVRVPTIPKSPSLWGYTINMDPKIEKMHRFILGDLIAMERDRYSSTRVIVDILKKHMKLHQDFHRP